MSKLKLVGAVFACILPFNWLRVVAYHLLLGYKIEGARIGFGTVIAVSEARLGRCKIGPFNQVMGPMSVSIGDGARIGDRNKFICGFWTLQYGEKYARRLEIGRDTLVTSGHYFDVAGVFVLGDGSWIAGVGSQVWTHGAGIEERNVSIGKDCYVGSAVRFAPGASLGNNVIVALGSVVTKGIEGDYLLVGGVPAAVIKRDYDWKAYDV
jgi:acetyltransferase-like isoleucine patch superfamily enzyme